MKLRKYDSEEKADTAYIGEITFSSEKEVIAFKEFLLIASYEDNDNTHFDLNLASRAESKIFAVTEAEYEMAEMFLSVIQA